MSKGNVEKINWKFQNVLDNGNDEAEVQRFLEKYPFILTMGRVPEGGTVISQFPLGAEFCVDFAFLFIMNKGTFLHLVEIESPRIKLFNNIDEFTQGYNHAIQQIQEYS